MPEPVRDEVTYKYLRMQRRPMTRAAWSDITSRQRSSSSRWASEWAFPGQFGKARMDVLERNSVCVANEFLCGGICGCNVNDCLFQFSAYDVGNARTDFIDLQSRESLKGQGEGSFAVVLASLIRGSYDRTANRWDTVRHNLSDFQSVDLCVGSYALLVGATQNAFDAACKIVKESASHVHVPSETLRANQRERNELKSLTVVFLQTYVRGLLNQHEMNPAPGAQRTTETNMPHRTKGVHWSERTDSLTCYKRGSNRS